MVEIELKLKGGPADGKTVQVGSVWEAPPYYRVAIPADHAESVSWRGPAAPELNALRHRIEVYELVTERCGGAVALEYVHVGAEHR